MTLPMSMRASDVSSDLQPINRLLKIVAMGKLWAAVLLDLLGPYTDESGPLHGGQPMCCALHSRWCWAPVADKLLKVEDRQVHGKQSRASAGLSGGSPLRRRLYGVQAQDNADFF